MRKIALLTCLVFLSFQLYSQCGSGTILLDCVKDNTIWSTGGAISNGIGSHVFVGRAAGQGTFRRALIQFDVTNNIPAGATITQVILTMNMSQTSAPATTIDLHRVSQDWGEGTSNSDGMGGGGGGGGTTATIGDATWLNTFYNTAFWTNQGGDYSSTVSTTLSITGVNSYAWPSSAQMVADVQDMLDNPSQNFGWILLQNGLGGAKRFDSRENVTAANRPNISVQYTLTALPVDIGPDTSICGGTITLDAGNPGSTYLWSTTSTAQTITVGVGTYSVTVTDTGGCSGTDTIIVSSAAGNVSFTGLQGSYCPNDPLDTLTGIPAGGTFSGPGMTGDVFDPAVPGTGGPYSIIYTYTDSLGCTEADTQQVTILNMPPVSISPPGDLLVCQGDSILLTGPNGATLQWTMNGSPIPGANGTTYWATQAGQYNMIKTNMNGCSDSAAVGVTVSFVAPVTAAFTVNQDTLILENGDSLIATDGSSGATSWCWDFGDGTTDTLQNPSHTYTTLGTYTVTLIAKNGNCTDTSSTTVVFVSLATREDLVASGQISVYPNPSAGEVMLELGPKVIGKEVSFVLIDLAGRRVFSKELPGIEHQQIQLQGISPGAYQFILETEGEIRGVGKLMLR